MGIQFITDSTSDLSCEYLQEHHIHLIPMIYQLDGREYVDSPFGGENTQTRREFYDAMRAGAHPTTTQINEIAYTEAFESILAAGDDVFFVGFSSGLTGSLNNAFRAREALLEKYKVKKADVIRKSELSEVYAYQIFSGVRVPERKKLLCLTIAMGINLDEVQTVLKCCGYAQLYVKNPFDCIVIYGICKNMSVQQINYLLYDYKMETLG